MIKNDIFSESDEGEIISDFEEDFQDELQNFPHVLKFIQRMRDHIKKQNKKITKLRNKLHERVRVAFLKYCYHIISYVLYFCLFIEKSKINAKESLN